MLKHTFFKNALAKATPIQRDIATQHFNLLWSDYILQKQNLLYSYQNRIISKGIYTKECKSLFRGLRNELKARIKVIL